MCSRRGAWCASRASLSGSTPAPEVSPPLSCIRPQSGPRTTDRRIQRVHAHHATIRTTIPEILENCSEPRMGNIRKHTHTITTGATSHEGHFRWFNRWTEITINANATGPLASRTTMSYAGPAPNQGRTALSRMSHNTPAAIVRSVSRMWNSLRRRLLLSACLNPPMASPVIQETPPAP